MIQRFRHKGLERLFTRGDTSGFDPQLAAKLRRMLILLERGTDPSGPMISYGVRELAADI